LQAIFNDEVYNYEYKDEEAPVRSTEILGALKKAIKPLLAKSFD